MTDVSVFKPRKQSHSQLAQTLDRRALRQRLHGTLHLRAAPVATAVQA